MFMIEKGPNGQIIFISGKLNPGKPKSIKNLLVSTFYTLSIIKFVLALI
jgi:hypothetical protein